MTVLTTIARTGSHAGVVNDHPSGEVPERALRRSSTAAYKLQVLADYEAAEPGQRGEVLRREGLYSSHLVEWRKARDAGALAGLAVTRGRPPADPVERDNRRLRERNARLEADLDTARRVSPATRMGPPAELSCQDHGTTWLPVMGAVGASYVLLVRRALPRCVASAGGVRLRDASKSPLLFPPPQAAVCCGCRPAGRCARCSPPSGPGRAS